MRFYIAPVRPWKCFPKSSVKYVNNFSETVLNTLKISIIRICMNQMSQPPSAVDAGLTEGRENRLRPGHSVPEPEPSN